MGHTYTSLAYHIVFSTKERRPLLSADIAARLVQFVGGILRERNGKLLAMNGPENHVHILGILAPKMSVSDHVRDIKSLTSGWIRDTFSTPAPFGWQEGYGGFSVGKSDLDRVIGYIETQPEHHRKTTFEEELVALLERAGIEYDPKYVFG